MGVILDIVGKFVCACVYDVASKSQSFFQVIYDFASLSHIMLERLIFVLLFICACLRVCVCALSGDSCAHALLLLVE